MTAGIKGGKKTDFLLALQKKMKDCALTSHSLSLASEIDDPRGNLTKDLPELAKLKKMCGIGSELKNM